MISCLSEFWISCLTETISIFVSSLDVVFLLTFVLILVSCSSSFFRYNKQNNTKHPQGSQVMRTTSGTQAVVYGTSRIGVESSSSQSPSLRHNHHHSQSLSTTTSGTGRLLSCDKKSNITSTLPRVRFTEDVKKYGSINNKMLSHHPSMNFAVYSSNPKTSPSKCHENSLAVDPSSLNPERSGSKFDSYSSNPSVVDVIQQLPHRQQRWSQDNHPNSNFNVSDESGSTVTLTPCMESSLSLWPQNHSSYELKTLSSPMDSLGNPCASPSSSYMNETEKKCLSSSTGVGLDLIPLEMMSSSAQSFASSMKMPNNLKMMSRAILASSISSSCPSSSCSDSSSIKTSPLHQSHQQQPHLSSSNCNSHPTQLTTVSCRKNQHRQPQS